MILTCPDCATSYFVDDDRVPAKGRTVKCSSCGNRWHATPESGAAPEAPPPRAPVQSEVSAAPRVRAAPMIDDLEVIGPIVEVAPKTPPKPARARKSRLGLFLGLGAAASLVAAIGAAVLFRQQIIDLAPAGAPVFRAVGLEVDTLGLVIEDVVSRAVLQGGRPVLSITGVIYNKTDAATLAPPIRISLLDKDGAAVAGLLAQPLNARVPPGARRYFAVSLPDPPSSARKLEVAFDPTATVAVAAAPASGPAADVVDAKPLPAHSPDAITPHESH